MEADEDFDNDSTFGGDHDSLASSTISLAAGVTDYPIENGRRYHAYQAGKYMMPNDQIELDRMELEHNNQRLMIDGRLYAAPLENPQEILDIGTGSGVWAIDMADQHPGASIIGTDLSPVQPTWLPPNCRFEVDDFEQEWTFGTSRFDFIHARLLLGAVRDHATLYKQAYHALKPGGYLEVSEMQAGTFSDDGTVTADMASVRWWGVMQEAYTRSGRPLIECERYPVLLAEAGFEGVTAMPIKRPTNDWPKDPKMKEIGRYCCANFLKGIEGFCMAPLTRVLGWSPTEVAVLLAQVREESVRHGIHGWQKAIRVYGRKPLAAEP